MSSMPRPVCADGRRRSGGAGRVLRHAVAPRLSAARRVGDGRTGQVRRLAGVILGICLGAAARGGTGDGSGDRPQTGGDLRYFGERRAAALALAAAEPGRAEIAAWLESPDEGRRRVACEAVARSRPDWGGRLLLDHLVDEPSPSLQRRMAAVLAVMPDRDDRAVSERLLAAGGSDRLSSVYEDYLLERTCQEIEALLHDGTVPGFYDGQFAALYAISPRMFDWLATIALDTDFNYVFRVMAIMGMHRARDARAVRLLASLMVHPAEEIAVDMTLRPNQTEADLESRRRTQLSRYCRFSLAKSGFPKYVDEKILFLRLELERAWGVLSRERGREEMSVKGELAAQLLFDIGYNHQQIDRYSRSIEWYSRVIDGWPHSSAAVNAHYNLACIYSIEGHVTEALDELEAAVRGGFTDFRWIVEDRDLEGVRNEPRFEKLVGLVRKAEQRAAAENEARGADGKGGRPAGSDG